MRSKAWAGVIPLATAAGAPERDDRLAETIALSPATREWVARREGLSVEKR